MQCGVLRMHVWISNRLSRRIDKPKLPCSLIKTPLRTPWTGLSILGERALQRTSPELGEILTQHKLIGEDDTAFETEAGYL